MPPPFPVSDAEFDSLMSKIPWEAFPSRLAVGVSGGADSLCLAWLLHRWATRTGRDVVALTVDHGLACFPEEASFAASLVQTWGFGQVCLPLKNPLPKTRLQEAARLGRYEALATWCHSSGIPALFVAHHLDDQRETFCLRLRENSGPRGLAGMQILQKILGLNIVRPLLSIPRARLQATLEASEIPWVLDPSNQSPAYARNRIRKQLSELPEEVCRFWDHEIQRLGHHRASFEKDVLQLFVQSHGKVMFPGYGLLDWEVMRSAAPSLQRGLLQQLLFWIGGGAKHPARREALDRVLSVFSRPTSGRLTVGGCLLEKRRARERGSHAWDLWIFREWQRIPSQTWPPGSKHLLWDGRFLLERTDSETDRCVKPQGLLTQRSQEMAPWQAYAAFPILKGEEYQRWLEKCPVL